MSTCAVDMSGIQVEVEKLLVLVHQYMTVPFHKGIAIWNHKRDWVLSFWPIIFPYGATAYFMVTNYNDFFLFCFSDCNRRLKMSPDKIWWSDLHRI